MQLKHDWTICCLFADCVLTFLLDRGDTTHTTWSVRKKKVMKTYRALPGPSPCRERLPPQTSGSLPAPVAKLFQVRLIDEKNTTGYGRNGKEERKWDKTNERLTNKTKYWIYQYQSCCVCVVCCCWLLVFLLLLFFVSLFCLLVCLFFCINLRNGQKKISYILYKCMTADTSVIWQHVAHTTNQFLLAAKQKPFNKPIF